ncbi:hypothetical protein GWI33_003684 [Rhynchophorus ferrugineus]|uniref:Uncharacterized protein n=1 Tax=Rhynchophorus ferrugineus TaxID=354439 RepID=A0A834M2V1_RHYFE|nr:hypothetical protein GWI33_003687 [Rhynchophorus ferrugineus]KAF7263054.1 hypothetical protein GWI33_003684 [Rhynchophorus ferrugineus]
MFVFVTAISKEEAEEHNHHHGKLPYNGYSDEFLDRLEPNGNIPAGKGYGKYLGLSDDFPTDRPFIFRISAVFRSIEPVGYGRSSINTRTRNANRLVDESILHR